MPEPRSRTGHRIRRLFRIRDRRSRAREVAVESQIAGRYPIRGSVARLWRTRKEGEPL